PGLSSTDMGSKFSKLLYKLPTHPAKVLDPKTFTTDPIGMGITLTADADW
ncbi:hypothetical protein A2U01_0046635, partial [Trifolium medium]|nr:hypothetical protein [Trifolium medium]